MAVLMIGTAFADADSLRFAPNRMDLLRTYLEKQIVPDFADTELKTLHYRNYPQLVKNIDALERFADAMVQNGESAEDQIASILRQSYGESAQVSVINELRLDWKTVGTLLFTYQNRSTDVLRKNLLVEIDGGNGRYTVTLTFAPFDTLLWLDSESDWFAAKNSYYYLNAVYDDDGTERLPNGYLMPTEKLRSLAFPLDAKWYTRIKTTWLRARDNGLRKHTGMDVRCDHGSPIYACAGGVVNSVGFHEKGGYYVAVTDDDGYEYFYYHMKKDSQCVVRGQRVETGEQLGLSGNTGNSAAPHLHLSVVTPEKRFVDPFLIYYRWVYLATGTLVKKPT